MTRKRKPLTPEQKARYAEAARVRLQNPEVRERRRAYQRAYGRNWNRIPANAARVASRKIEVRYGLTPDEYNDLIDAGCGICGRTEWLVVDHDHGCCPGTYTCGNCVRGVLCRSCNSALGTFGDNADGIDAAIRYLRQYEQRRTAA